MNSRPQGLRDGEGPLRMRRRSKRRLFLWLGPAVRGLRALSDPRVLASTRALLFGRCIEQRLLRTSVGMAQWSVEVVQAFYSAIAPRSEEATCRANVPDRRCH